MKYILIILTFLAIIGCKKTETFTAHGNVKHIFTNNNIPDIYVTIGFYMPTVSATNAAYAYTDKEGNYSISFDYKSKESYDGEFGIEIPHVFGLDTTEKNNQFISTYIVLTRNELTNSNDFKLVPSGQVGFYASDSSWNAINADSILIQSPYETKYLIRNVTNDAITYFHVDPSIESTFNWCYIKNDTQSAKVTKNILVPNCYTYRPGNFKYQLKF
jgi:hypothetical protein